MKKFLLGLALTAATFTATAQTEKCAKTCEIERVVNGGPFLGVNIQSLRTKSDVKVRKVVEGTAADRMGIKAGDILVSVNGVTMETYLHTKEFITSQRVGQPVKVVVIRDGKKKVFRGELGFDQTQTITETVCCDELGNSLALNRVNVYPNPSKGDFQLSFEGIETGAYNLQIVDLKGNVVFENKTLSAGKQVQEQISANIPAAGKYLLVIEKDGRTFTKQVVFVK